MKKILAVDNHPVMLKFITNLLEKEGYQVLTAKDGLSALDILDTYSPNVVFVDLVMPNIDGKKLCRIIRRRPDLRDVYIIVLSAIAAEEDIDVTEFGANACIAKGPFDKMAKNILSSINQLKSEASNGPPEKIIGLGDIYSREITKELLSVKRHFEVILRSMSDGVLEVASGGRIVYANAEATSLLGMSEEELLASRFYELFAGEERSRIKGLLSKMEDGTETFVRGYAVKLNSRQFSMTALSIEDREHNTIVILNDITERKRMEDQFTQAQKMEAIGTLAAGIAHDFNNLLMGIQGNTSLMLLDIDPMHPYYEKLKGIEKQVKSGSKLTGQLLGYARKGKYEVKPINLNRLVEETSYAFGRTRKEITIHHEFVEEIFPIEADQGQVEQVLLNLYVNAADAMPRGGDLYLKTQNARHTDMKSKLYNPKPGNYVLLTITDTGTGMNERIRERIFEPFFTTKEMGRGTGLGLASVYGIIKSHGGYIEVDSKEGHGTTFSIYLPKAKNMGKKHRSKSIKGAEIQRGSETVLFVDDERVVCEIGRDMLKAMGYNVLTAGDGGEAIKVYKENRDDIELVLLDMIMPNMGGGELYDKIKEINEGVKVLLSSGYSIDGQATEILERGCDGFIQKPFSMKQLSHKIRDILDA